MLFKEVKMELVFSFDEMTAIIAAIVTIIAGLFAIGFYIRRVLREYRKRREQLDIPNKFPPGFHEFLTKDAKVSRENYQTTLVQRGHLISKQEPNIEDILPADETDSLTEPFISLPPETYMVDTICTALTREGKTILILPSIESQLDVEAVGRTSVLLRLLGLRVRTSRLIGLDLEGFHSLEEIPIAHDTDGRWAYLLATDIAFLGSSGKKLSVVPTKGEKMSFVWDLARYTFRVTELGYRTGDHRKDPGRQKLLAIFEKIRFKPLDGIFGKLDRLYLVDEIFLLRRDISNTLRSPELRELKGKEAVQELRKALFVSMKHGSPFWRKNEGKLKSYVDQVVNSLDMSKIPTVNEIRFSNPEPEVNSRYFDEIADIIKTKQNPVTGEISETIVQIKGIAFHNDELMTRLNHVEEVRLLVTSGEKIFNEKQFWDRLSRIKKTLVLKILMLNPDAPATDKRQEEAYADKSPGFLVDEIRENIATILRMRVELGKTGSGVRISCALYDEVPPFRLTFIGTETLLVTSYEKGKRTGKETEFCKLTRQQMGSVYDGFNLEFERVESKSKMI
jgi:hypothetical protein